MLNDDARGALRGALSNALCNASNFPPKVMPHILGQNMTPLIDATANAVVDWLAAHDREMNERERVRASNEIAEIVFAEVKRVWPDLHPLFDLRYGIADAVIAAGYRKPHDSGSPS